MLEENKLRADERRVYRIGGKVSNAYNMLLEEIEIINENAFIFWRPFHEAVGYEVSVYLQIARKGLEVVLSFFQEYKYNEFLRSVNNDLEGTKYPSFESAKRGIYLRSRLEFNRYAERIKKIQRRIPPVIFSTRTIEYFEECLFLDPDEGLLVDTTKFLTKYDEITKTRQTVRYKLHLQAVEAINKFFEHTIITEAELKKYFVIQSGKIRIRPKIVGRHGYMRLEG